MVAIVCICHQGELEIKTAFLIYTLRKYLKGEYKLYVGIPEENHYLEKPSSVFFEFCSNNSVHIFSFRNKYLDSIRFLKDGDLISNKIYIWNRKFCEEHVVFLDSDTMIIRSFNVTEFITNAAQIMIKPADRKNVTQWEELYSLAGIPYPKTIIFSTIDCVKMPPYFNSGVIVFKSSSIVNIRKVWLEYYLWLSNEETIKKLHFPIFHRNQISLALAIAKSSFTYSLLDEKYNFPVRGKTIPSTLPYIIHYHTPLAIYSEPILKNEFLGFIINHMEILQNARRDWRILFGDTKLKRYFFLKTIQLKLLLKNRCLLINSLPVKMVKLQSLH